MATAETDRSEGRGAIWGVDVKAFGLAFVMGKSSRR
jgi:hypothetical protein